MDATDDWHLLLSSSLRSSRFGKDIREQDKTILLNNYNLFFLV